MLTRQSYTTTCIGHTNCCTFRHNCRQVLKRKLINVSITPTFRDGCLINSMFKFIYLSIPLRSIDSIQYMVSRLSFPWQICTLIYSLIHPPLIKHFTSKAIYLLYNTLHLFNRKNSRVVGLHASCKQKELTSFYLR